MTVAETGTRGLLGACFGPTSAGETGYATRLLPRLDDRHLVLIDRGFDANAFLQGVAATGAQFLVRLTSRNAWYGSTPSNGRSNLLISRPAPHSRTAASCARATASASSRNCGPPSLLTNCCAWP